MRCYGYSSSFASRIRYKNPPSLYYSTTLSVRSEPLERSESEHVTLQSDTFLNLGATLFLTKASSRRESTVCRGMLAEIARSCLPSLA